jgi:hypothetical protein
VNDSRRPCKSKRPQRFNKDKVDSVPLLYHIETVIDIGFRSRDKEVASAYQSMEKRLDGMNEFRDTLKDQAAKFVTRAELMAAVIGVSTIISIFISILMRVMK